MARLIHQCPSDIFYENGGDDFALEASDIFYKKWRGAVSNGRDIFCEKWSSAAREPVTSFANSYEPFSAATSRVPAIASSSGPPSS